MLQILKNSKMNKKLFFLFLLPVFFMTTISGQKTNRKVTITGIVTDASQNPVAGASIFIDQKQTNILTDMEGRYKVKVKPSSEMISVASSVYGASESAINGRTEINFIFSGTAQIRADSPGKKAGEESMQVGYSSQKKKDLSASVGKVNGQNPKYASYSSIYTMIRGEVPGVQVSGKSITIRGRNSINSGGQPLIIVDGIMTSSLDNITPQMVKSIEVIKDASASIYGTRGANGVIIITLIK
jgi:TonB-dependent SusC/RagA subfamily outer membrane receptor